ncbi:MAG: hypothetical protein LBR22_04950 [Desulfovibrio sp.]|jgi:hypothetical protein|nr:hypothetical protein [Desulfovibrio sp.]
MLKPTDQAAKWKVVAYALQACSFWVGRDWQYPTEWMTALTIRWPDLAPELDALDPGVPGLGRSKNLPHPTPAEAKTCKDRPGVVRHLAEIEALYSSLIAKDKGASKA